jgi:hypothetical protein
MRRSNYLSKCNDKSVHQFVLFHSSFGNILVLLASRITLNRGPRYKVVVGRTEWVSRPWYEAWCIMHSWKPLLLRLLLFIWLGKRAARVRR